jgi:CBS domain-containing protein
MSFGLPVEGEKGPFAGGALVDVPTCAPDDEASEVADRLAENGEERAAVVIEGMPVGLVTLDALRAGDDAGPRVRDRMELIPDTIRPSVELSRLDEKTAGRLVTSSNGVLLGAVDPAAIQREHEVEHEVMEVVDDIEAHFGDREPSKDEVHAFLRDRLVDRGHDPEEAEELLAETDGKG